MSLLLRLLVAAPIIFIVCCQSSPPYKLGINRAHGNSLILRCLDKFGTEVPGASFQRNSQRITNSSCLMAYPTGSSSVLNLTLASQECDGYFSCGVTGENGILSSPVKLYACPMTNVSKDRTVDIEEGKNVSLTCDFPPSPIKQYTTVWLRGPYGSSMQVQNTQELQSYELTSDSAQNNDEYLCEVRPSIDDHCNIRYLSKVIKIQITERYEPPMITKDLNYTRYTDGDGVFSVSTSGTNLTHKWYKNDRLINNTGAGILTFGNDAITVDDSNGLLRITYEASNVDYDNMTHTTRQTFGLYTSFSQDGSDVSTESEGQVLAIGLGVVALIETLSIPIILIVVAFIYFKCKARKKDTEPLQAAQLQSGDSNQEATHYCKKCLKKKVLKPMEHILLCSFSLVQDCETNYEFLHCLTTMFTNVMHKRNIDGKCKKALTKMRNEMEKLMESRKPQKTGEKMVYDGSHGESMTSDGQHEQDDKIYEKYKELFDLFDNCIKNVAPR